jgi:hypothetical protein
MRTASEPNTHLVSAQITYRSRTDLPLIGLLVPDITIRAAASMRAEP